MHRKAIRNLQSEIRNWKKRNLPRKPMKLQIPFIANNGQVDDRVVFYANTFGGTVFVTKDGDIVYTLPNNSAELGVQSLEGKNDRIQNTEDCIVHPASWIVDRDSKSEFQNPKSTSTDSKKPKILKFKIRNPKLVPRLRSGDLKSGIALREEFVGAKVKTIQGEVPVCNKGQLF